LPYSTQFSNNFALAQSSPIMKTFLIFCVCLVFVKSDLVRDLRRGQSFLNSISLGDINEADLEGAIATRKEELKCFLREFKKDANNERINVSAHQRVIIFES
jgi:hypothetical protein